LLEISVAKVAVTHENGELQTPITFDWQELEAETYTVGKRRKNQSR